MVHCNQKMSLEKEMMVNCIQMMNLEMSWMMEHCNQKMMVEMVQNIQKKLHQKSLVKQWKSK